MKLLEGKTALITGGGSGIGRSVAEKFYGNGANLIITGRRAETLEDTRNILGGGTERCLVCPADVTSQPDIERLIRESINQYGRIDIVVNAAGMMVFQPVESATADFLQRVFAVNTFAPVLLTAAVLPAMRKQKYGVIINFSSLSGIRPAAGSSAYCASKAAVKMFTEVCALEAAADNIRVNAIAPGLVEDTGLGKEMFSEKQVQEAYARFRPLHPLGRNGKPDEIADLVLFLASEQSSWITGVTIPVDGGRHLSMNG